MMDGPSHYTKKETTVQKIGQKILKGTRNKPTGMWEVTLEQQQSKPVVNSILSQTTKPELAQYFHAALFIPPEIGTLNKIKKGFFKIWPGLTEGLTKKHIEK